MKILLLYTGKLSLSTFNKDYANPITEKLGSFVEVFPYSLPTLPSADAKREWIVDRKDFFKQYDLLLLADTEWFKLICKVPKVLAVLGVAHTEPSSNLPIFYIPTTGMFYANPDKAVESLRIALDGIYNHLQGVSTNHTLNFIQSENYPLSVDAIKEQLETIKQFPMLFCDIEAKSLRVTDAGIYTIGFAWDKHNGTAFPVDASPEANSIKQLLREFFESYKGRLVFHKANFDVPAIIYSLYQTGLDDVEGQLKGLNALFKGNRVDDTLIITYLATNSCSGNTLGLKELAANYAGDWAEDVSDVTKVPLDRLLKYNLIDCLSTAYVYETYYPKMVQDEQEELYKTFMLPTLRTNVRCQLNGLPIDIEKVKQLKQNLETELSSLINIYSDSSYIKQAEELLTIRATEARNAKLKKKVTTLEDNQVTFMHTSPIHLAALVHEIFKLPVLDVTDKGKPKLGKNDLKGLIEHTSNVEIKNILDSIAAIKDIEKILTSFIPAFLEAPKCGDGNRLTGYFNIGGTVSGRLSSSNLNMQQLPATGSRFAKPVKKCFTSNTDWVLCGIDFASLEDYVSALTTRDTNKLKVYLDGYDGHCLRAYYYKDPNEMSDIRQAEPEDKCYSCTIDGKTIYFLGSDTIHYQGQTFTGNEFYEQYFES